MIYGWKPKDDWTKHFSSIEVVRCFEFFDTPISCEFLLRGNTDIRTWGMLVDEEGDNEVWLLLNFPKENSESLRKVTEEHFRVTDYIFGLLVSTALIFSTQQHWLVEISDDGLERVQTVDANRAAAIMTDYNGELY